jgi:hypothetical protein
MVTSILTLQSNSMLCGICFNGDKRIPLITINMEIQAVAHKYH